MTNTDFVLVTVLGVPHLCLMISGFWLQWQLLNIYRRIGGGSIGATAFFTQLAQPGINFPGPNVLEARIAALPANLQVDIEVVRRRLRYLRRAIFLYVGYLILTVFLFRMFGS